MPTLRLAQEDFARLGLIFHLTDSVTHQIDEPARAIYNFAEELCDALQKHDSSEILAKLLVPGQGTIRVEIDDTVLDEFIAACETMAQRGTSKMHVYPFALFLENHAVDH